MKLTNEEIQKIEQLLRDSSYAKYHKRHIEAAQAGEFVTVNQLFEAYQKEIGRTSTRDGLYYLLKRHGWRTVTPRPEHPKKADAQTIETSKNKIYIRNLK